jgi:hypothetical protein
VVSAFEELGSDMRKFTLRRLSEEPGFPRINFSLLHNVQTGSWFYPACLSMGARSSFSGGIVVGA